MNSALGKENHHRMYVPALILAVLSAMAGCSTMTFVRTPLQHEPEPGKGLVLLSVTSNADTLGKVDAVVLSPADSIDRLLPAFEVSYEIPQAGEGAEKGTALFVASLPPGRYAVQSLVAHYYGRILYVEPSQTIRVPGTFTVEAGNTTDLGRLVVNPIGNRVAVQRSRTDTDNADLADALVPALNHWRATAQRLGWSSSTESSNTATSLGGASPGGSAPSQRLDNKAASASLEQPLSDVRRQRGH